MPDPHPIPPAFWSLSPAGSGSRSEPDSSSSEYLDLSLRLGFHSDQQDRGGDWRSDEFFIGRRSGTGSESTGEFSFAYPVGRDGLRISGSGSDSGSDGQIVAIGEDSDLNNLTPRLSLNAPFCWDCLQIDEDGRDINDEFEWEEIEEAINLTHELENEAAAAMNLEWEVLLTNFASGDVTESFFDDGFDYDEVTFAQFHEHHDGAVKGSPPAAKSAVESLPSFVLTEEDVEKSCAVCKDVILADEKGKRLPCLHCYHEQCILPWLGMRNTCPLCRYELPTDDPEYESWKARRAGVGEDDGIRYDFEILPEA